MLLQHTACSVQGVFVSEIKPKSQDSMCFTDVRKYMSRVIPSLQSISDGYRDQYNMVSMNDHKGVQIRPNHKSPLQKSEKNTIKNCLGNHVLFILIHHNSLI